ncbi:MAG: phage major capsid protein [Planctomycetota bacterium]|jgi:hypothetical protein
MTVAIGFDTSTNKDLFKTLLGELFNNTLEPALVECQEVFKMVKVKDYYDRDARMAGIGLASEIEDGEAIGTQDPTYGQTKEWTQARWGTGFRVTAGFKKAERWNIVNDLTKNLKISMLESKDIDVSSIYNSATGTTITGFDGLALASSAHTCLDDDSTTYDNYGDAALGVTSLKDARLYFQKLVKDDGQRLVVKPDKLVVNADLEYTAMELTRSDGKVNSADNNINIHKSAVPYFVYNRLTATTSWFLLAKQNPKFGVKIMTWQEPQLHVMAAPEVYVGDL